MQRPTTNNTDSFSTNWIRSKYVFRLLFFKFTFKSKSSSLCSLHLQTRVKGPSSDTVASGEIRFIYFFNRSRQIFTNFKLTLWCSLGRYRIILMPSPNDGASAKLNLSIRFTCKCITTQKPKVHRLGSFASQPSTMANAYDFYFCCRHIVRLTAATNRTRSYLDAVDDALVALVATKVNRMRRLRTKSSNKVLRSVEVPFTVSLINDRTQHVLNRKI